MLQVDDKIVSLDLFKEMFCCDLDKCLGLCCVHGDSGAPLEKKEIKDIKKNLPVIRKYITAEGIKAIDKIGVSMVDKEQDIVTPLIDNSACAYINYDQNGIAYCGIEKAFLDKKCSFRKPVSCYLYPIRLKVYEKFVAVNYDQWDLCRPARVLGNKKRLKVFQFLKEPIICKFGEEFYNQLEIADIEIDFSSTR